MRILNISKYIVFALFAVVLTASAQDDVNAWREKMKYLIYSPRYFGPNAFPIPELHSGRISERWEAEIGGDYHTYSGDKTKDVFVRLFIPIAHGLAGIEVSDVIYEYYKMTPETVEERYAAGTEWKDGAHGDIVVKTFFQVLKNERLLDLSVEAALKSASGNRLVDARYTDAAAYWFDLNVGRNVYCSEDLQSNFRLQGLIGFYCWETNDLVHRQNDALVYSIGFGGKIKGFSATADIAGIYGYENNGDRPVQLCTKLNYEYKKNCLSLRYKHGMKDSLYDSFSVGYIRFF